MERGHPLLGPRSVYAIAVDTGQIARVGSV